MKKTRRSFLRAKKRSACVTSDLFEATLLNPTEVEKYLRDFPQKLQEKLRGHWLLNGTVSKSRFSILAKQTSSYVFSEMSAFMTPSGAGYVVVSCQLSDWQHRFILPLYCAKVMAFFAEDTGEPLMFELSCAGGGDEGLIFDCPLPRDVLTSIWDFGNEVDLENTGQFVLELPFLINDMLKAAGMPTSPIQVIRHVDVSVLMPYGDDDCCEDETEFEVTA